MKISIDFDQERELRKKMNRAPRKVKREINELGKEAQQVMHRKLVQHASGPPGPSRVSGQYVERFKVTHNRFGSGFVLKASNNSPQAARLEYGFYGTDSRGRNVSQAPRPHFRPALIETQEWFLEEANKIIDDALQ